MSFVRPISLVLIVLGTIACGGGGAGASAATAANANQIPAGATISFTSGETNQPVAGAVVTVAGHHYVTDSAGTVVLGRTLAVADKPLVDVVADGYLDRQTVLRKTTDARFSLWPSTSSSVPNFSAHFTEEIVYTNAGTYPGQMETLGKSRLVRLRPDITKVYVHPLEPLLSNSHAMDGARLGIESINAGIGGTPLYVLSPDSPPGDAIVITVEVHNGDDYSACGRPAAGCFAASMTGPYINGGRVAINRWDSEVSGCRYKFRPAGTFCAITCGRYLRTSWDTPSAYSM